ncbi:fructose bisphosphate aldolase [Sulfitobacter sp. D35]|uniref:fructose bisphosphate aldolase n=1 Tax=Sulfitobacter sp. D35 TaxID=3083252 RepID=UPI00296F9C27|nr:fructose bisphosphate aldolase [Sulfitobacter sp. D35]MDW4496386.1 fructose bisphosphate aldolase [Sulfitobacter sp. D35]
MSDLGKMRDQMKSGQGFIAALDQSGGSTPKALSLYGVEPSDYAGDEEMFARIHEMRSRIILADAFTSEKVIGAILFERTMQNEINGTPVAELLWRERGIVPFLKIDKGLQAASDGVQLMKPMPGLEDLLKEAVAKGIFGTKERSVIQEADAAGIKAIVAQQFEVGATVLAAGLVPILEPEVDIHSPTKAEAEEMLKQEIEAHLDTLPEGAEIMLKLTLPTQAGLYDQLAQDPRILRIVALSGGYSTDEASEKLAQNSGMIASFSRALTEGLNAKMSDAEFESALGSNVDQIYRASVA